MYIYLWLAFVLVFHAPFKEVSLKSSQFFLLAISLNQHTTFFCHCLLQTMEQSQVLLDSLLCFTQKSLEPSTLVEMK